MNMLETKTLSNYSTRDLVEELKTRVGVNYNFIEPNEKKQFEIEGHSIILEIID